MCWKCTKWNSSIWRTLKRVLITFTKTPYARSRTHHNLPHTPVLQARSCRSPSDKLDTTASRVPLITEGQLEHFPFLQHGRQTNEHTELLNSTEFSRINPWLAYSLTSLNEQCQKYFRATKDNLITWDTFCWWILFCHLSQSWCRSLFNCSSDIAPKTIRKACRYRERKNSVCRAAFHLPPARGLFASGKGCAVYWISDKMHRNPL